MAAFIWFIAFVAGPMLIIAFAPYWLVAITMAAYVAFWYFGSIGAAADPDPDPYEDAIHIGYVLGMAYVMTFVIRIISAYH